MGLSGVLVFLCVIEPSAHLTDPGRPLCRVSRACPPALAAGGLAVAACIPEKSRARLSCICSVDDEVVLDGEALVKVPSEKTAKGKRPIPKL
jgi:hypothetical protein